MARQNKIEIVIDADTRQAERGLKSFGKRLGGVGDIAKMAIGVGLGGALTALPGMIKGASAALGDFIEESARIQQTEMNFNNLAKSIGATGDAMLRDLRDATRGMVSDAELMAAANKFMSMGLADSQEEAAKLAETATQLGMAMGVDATQAMDDFALMLANQSIPRLDTFGISSSKVRERIDELMDSTEGMTREQAFLQATMEEAAGTMAKVGEQGDTMFAGMERGRATMDNLKKTLGDALMPIVEAVRAKFAEWGAVLGDLVNYFMAVFRDGDTLNDFLMHLPEPIRDIVKSIGDWVVALKEWLPKALAIAQATIIEWRDKATEAWNAVKETASEWWAVLNENVFTPLSDWFEDFKQNTLPKWQEMFAASFEDAKADVVDFWEGVKPAFEGMDEYFNDWIAETLPEITRLWENLGELWGTITEITEPLQQALTILNWKLFGTRQETEKSAYQWGELFGFLNSMVVKQALINLEAAISAIADALKILNYGLERANELIGQMGGISLGDLLVGNPLDLFSEGNLTRGISQGLGRGLARDPTAPPQTVNNYNLTVNSMAGSENLAADFQMIQAMGGAK